MLKKEEILKFVSENKELFKEKYGILKIGIIGSFARNEQTENSDIDFIIETKPNTPDISRKKQELKEILEQKFQCEIDLCHVNSSDPIFKKLVLNEIIYA